MSDTVLLEVTCAGCEVPRDVWGEDQAGQTFIDPADLRCPGCDCPHVSDIKPRESLA